MSCVCGPPRSSPCWPLLPAKMGALLTVTLQTYALAPTLHVSHSLCPPLAPRSHLYHQLCLRWPCRKCQCPETCLTALTLAGRPLLPGLSHHRPADDTIYIPHPSGSRSENLTASSRAWGVLWTRPTPETQRPRDEAKDDQHPRLPVWTLHTSPSPTRSQCPTTLLPGPVPSVHPSESLIPHQ